MKEKLVLPFFWLAVIAWGLDFFATALSTISLGPLAAIVSFVKFFVTILLALVFIRLISELAVAIFRINDNLSPDGGKSETANIDPIAEARKVAEAAAERARDAAKVAGEKTQAATKSARSSMSNMTQKNSETSKVSSKGTSPEPAAAKPKASKAKVAPSRKSAPKNPVVKSNQAAPTAKKQPAAPASKPQAVKPKTKGAKRGPKPGVKVRRDAQGRLLKKDGTLRAKPGPKNKS